MAMRGSGVNNLPRRSASGANPNGVRTFKLGRELIAALKKRRDVNWSEYVRRCLREALALPKKKGAK